MDDRNRELLTKEWNKFQKNVDQEVKKTREDMSLIEIDAEPNDVEITSTDRKYWEHEILNFSPFDVVCRTRATNSNLFSVNKSAFRIKSNGKFILKVCRAPHAIRSHHLKIDVTMFMESFQPPDFLDYFIGPYPYKTFIIRIHGAPRYWSDALKMNEWKTTEKLNELWDAEFKKTSKEKKSLDTSEVSSMQEQQEFEDDPDVPLANMNKVNVMIMSIQNTSEGMKEEQQGVSSESDLDETIENELKLMS